MKTVLLGGMLSGLCLSAPANTTDNTTAQVIISPVQDTNPGPVTPLPTRIGLLLPLHSESLGEAAQAVRDGFMAAHERDPGGTEVTVFDSGDTPQDILSNYAAAATDSDIVVGPLSRSGTTALAQSDAIGKSTIALTAPEGDAPLPRRMLVIGLSIEDEARQAADWAAQDKALKKAFILYTDTPWQRRAAKAFESQWKQRGKEVESIELAATGGYLSGRALLQFKRSLPQDKSSVLFAALDARQGRQLRSLLGDALPLYGTSQLNPLAAQDKRDGERIAELNGARLLDIPWLVQAEHPAVMIYPRPVGNAEQKVTADMERLYALGIDAYRIAREVAANHGSFELDGVTGTLKVRFDGDRTRFSRTELQAVYKDGVVAVEGGQ
jgi:outer membrane PBP1 activator LpoA protein